MKNGNLVCFLCGAEIPPEKYEIHVGFCTGKGVKLPVEQMDVPGPKAIRCYICGKAFFKSSIDIHIKSCQKAWIKNEELKPPKARRPLPQPPKDYEKMKAMLSVCPKKPAKKAIPEPPINPYEDEEYLVEAFKQWQATALVPCERCGRKFAPDRFHAHLKSCTPAPPKTTVKKPIKKQLKFFLNL